MTRVLCPDPTPILNGLTTRSIRPTFVVEAATTHHRRWRLIQRMSRLVEIARARAHLVAAQRRLRREVLRSAPLAAGERPLEIYCDGDDVLVATSHAFYHRAGNQWPRLGWEDVTSIDVRASSDQVRLAALTRGGPRRVSLSLPDRDSLVDIAHERVASTHLLTADVELLSDVSAIVTARRQPDSGTVIWQVATADVVDLAAPANQAEIRAAVERLSGHIGS